MGIQVATMLLILVALGVSYVALRPARLPSGRPLSLPAIESPATPTAAATGQETLAAIVLPAGAIPSDIVGGLNHYTVPPGASSNWEPGNFSASCCTGPRLDYVLSGNLTMRNVAPTQLQRAGSTTWEEIPSDTEIVLGPGDALLSRMEAVFAAANRGTTPVEVLDSVIFSGHVDIDPIPDGWLYHSARDQDIIFNPRSAPDVPMALRLQRTTLAPDAYLPIPADAVAQLLISLDTRAMLAIFPNPDPHDTQNTGARYVKKHVGPEPVSVYVLTLEPAGAGQAVIATPTSP
jgi:hypothetical protein